MKRIVYILAIVLAGLLADKAEARKLNMSIDETRIASYITKYALAYNIEREILSCVLFVESSYRVNIISDTDDYGMGQINGKTIKGYNFDRLRLLDDIGYSIKAAAIVLSDFKRFFKQREINDWPARYNIGWQDLTENSIGATYVNYNKKLRSCIASETYL